MDWHSVLASIPDIRSFWSKDTRFLSQFTPGKISTFKPYSKYYSSYRDVGFWQPRAVCMKTTSIILLEMWLETSVRMSGL